MAEPPSPPLTTQPADAEPTPPAEPAAATATDPATDLASEAEAKELEAVVRAWSAALNAGDNEAAADLFAPGALIVQAGVAVQLPDRDAAVQWNASLPCSGPSAVRCFGMSAAMPATLAARVSVIFAWFSGS